ncbi:MAG: HAD family hydrolase [Paracoccus sp. (in: a-proteobacteria)]|uniref:HAD family hydrolase n=1 Tax=Paracoccus sp. TaxID=267 RepID=UPI0026E08B09|nr:HAD family hydrolase [Paracoccus sp. (in: a-proteobacteria)]MDO5631240.1 HAD family hydrolase [Paracoccus sp. (in: a-proteobacteria)]
MTALIFDCDGVLVDSEPLSVAELGLTLRDAGAAITDQQIFDRMIGRPIAEIVAIVAAETGADATPLLPDYRDRLRARFDAELQPIPGIRDAIRAMPPGPRAVASSSTLPRLDHCLRLTGLHDLFAPHIFSATQVARGKPAPDLFLFAAAQLNTQPADCIVIEDSIAGVTAAKAAGMRVIGFLGGGHARAAHLADRLPALHPDAIIASAAELPETLRAMMATA